MTAIALLNEENINILKSNDTVISSARNYRNGLWDIPIQKTRIQEYNTLLIQQNNGSHYHNKDVIGS